MRSFTIKRLFDSHLFKCAYIYTKKPAPHFFSSQSRFYKVYNIRAPSSPSLLRPLLFASGVTLGFFAIFSISDENKRRKHEHLYSLDKFLKDSVDNVKAVFYNDDAMTSQANRRWESFKGQLPSFLRSSLWEIEHQWVRFSCCEKTLACIIVINVLIFCAWKVPSLYPFMSRHFLTSPQAPVYTLLTHTFSHYDLFHLGLNMYALWSFGSFIHNELGRDQFLFFYLSSGVWSGYASLLYKVLTKSYAMGLGASGGIFALLGGAAHYPHLKVSLFFLPFLAIPISYGVLGMVLFDVYGLVAKRFRFDHMAHLSGCAIGYLYFVFGSEHIWANRRKFLALIGYV